MRRSSSLLLAGLAAGSLAVSFMVACGGTETSPSGSTTTGAGGGGPAPELATPPQAGEGAPAPDGTGSTVVAIKKLYLGDTNRDGTANKVNGWKQYGYDLDGKASTATSTDLCKPRNNTAPKSLYPDGNKGIDNSFGKNILTIITSLAADASTKVNESIGEGKFTIMLSMDKLGAGKDYSKLNTKLYGGSALGSVPKFDGTDKWPVIPELLATDGDITSAKVQFPQAYLVNNTWVSQPKDADGTFKGEVALSLSVSGFTLALTISSAVLTMDLSADHKSASNGIIAGVLPTDVLTKELRKVAGSFDAALCKGNTVDSLIAQIEQASDIMADGSQDPSKECDGISIGLGFDGAVVQLGDIGPKATPGVNPCDTGAGGGTSSSASSTSTGM
jgi:hypothetical protein